MEKTQLKKSKCACDPCMCNPCTCIGCSCGAGAPFPQFRLADQTAKIVKFADLCGPQGLIVYIYPKDNTPGCTMEAQDFTRLSPTFRRLGFHIVGLSKDSVEAHVKFIEKCSLGIPLLSDPSGDLIEKLGAWGEKNAYGKITTGIIRSTFVLDSKRKVLRAYRNVKATGHAEKVLRELKECLG